MRSARTSRMRALVCEESVTMPAWEPEKDSAWKPRSFSTMAASAHEIRSPVESSMSISRGSGRAETSLAIRIRSSVVLPRAESTTATRLPPRARAAIRSAARLIRSASATEVPPNFMTTVSARSEVACGMRAKDSFRHVRDRLRRPSRGLLAALAVAGVVLVAAITLALMGGDDDTTAKRATTPPPPDRPIVRRSFLEQVIPARGSHLPGADVPARIAAQVKAMPVEDKVAQVMLLGFQGNGAGAPVHRLLRERPLGGIVIRRANYGYPAQLSALA